MFVFNRLPCEFQVKKLHCPRKFTCQPGRRKGVCKITPKSDGKLSFTLVVQFVGHTGIRDASAAPFKAFRPRRNNQHLPICGQRLSRRLSLCQSFPMRILSEIVRRRWQFSRSKASIQPRFVVFIPRSEERRVGKECIARCLPVPLKRWKE